MCSVSFAKLGLSFTHSRDYDKRYYLIDPCAVPITHLSFRGVRWAQHSPLRWLQRPRTTNFTGLFKLEVMEQSKYLSPKCPLLWKFETEKWGSLMVTVKPQISTIHRKNKISRGGGGGLICDNQSWHQYFQLLSCMVFNISPQVLKYHTQRLLSLSPDCLSLSSFLEQK